MMSAAQAWARLPFWLRPIVIMVGAIGVPLVMVELIDHKARGTVQLDQLHTADAPENGWRVCWLAAAPLDPTAPTPVPGTGAKQVQCTAAMTEAAANDTLERLVQMAERTPDAPPIPLRHLWRERL